MPLPKYFELYTPFLNAISDEQTHSLKEIKTFVIGYLSLDDESLNEKLPSGKQNVFDNRLAWARLYLKKAGLIESPKRASFKITKEGKLCLTAVSLLPINCLRKNMQILGLSK